MHPPRLKYIFFEFQSDPGAGTPIRDDLVRERDVYWRDWDSVLAGFRKFALGLSSPLASSYGDPLSLGRLMYFGPLLSADFRLWVRNVTHFGDGFSIIRRAFGSRADEASEADMPRSWNGFFPMSQAMTGKILWEYPEIVPGSEGQSGEASAGPHHAQPIEPIRAPDGHETYSGCLTSAARGYRKPRRRNQCTAGSLFLAYDNPDRYPQFYVEENRLDRQHLNARGADLFSKELAEDFLRALNSHVVRQACGERPLARSRERC